MKMFRKNKKGFTLVELVIVIAVLAVLAAIAIPVAGNIVERARTNADLASIATYQSAIEQAVANGDEYPTSDATAAAIVEAYLGVDTVPAPQGGDTGDAFVFDPADNKVKIDSPSATEGSELFAISAVK